MLPYRVDEFMVDCHNKGLSPKTMGSYEQALRLFERYMLEQCEVCQEKDITSAHITGYVNYLQQRGKYTAVADERSRCANFPQNRRDTGDAISATAINNYLRNMNVFFNWMESERMIRKNPIQKTHFLSAPRRPRAYMEDTDFNRLLKCLEMQSFSEYRDSVIIQLLLDSGMRIGECLLIRDADLNLEINTIFLPAANTKGKKDRYVYFGNRMAKELRRWLQFRDRYRTSDFLFCTNRGNPLKVTNFESNMRKYCQRAKLPDVSPHTFRNNFAKRFLMNGGDIYTLSRILGHSSVTVTEQAYLDLTEADLRKKYQEYSPLSKIKSYY